jgi:competence protein ComEC
MRIIVALFASGIWIFQQQAELPPASIFGPAWLAWSVLAAGAGGLHLRLRQRLARPPARLLALLLLLGVPALCAGLLWAAQRAQWRLGDALPMVLEGQDVALVGRIAELPQLLDDGVRFVFEVESAAIADASVVVPRRVLLSWYRERDESSPLPMVLAGERWAFSARLKRPHGFVNPSGFDHEAWLLERDLRAGGYVRGGAQRLDAEPGTLLQAVHRLRGTVRTRFLQVLGEAPHAGLLVALAVGDQRAIPASQWETFRRTGISHLVAISGMHVALAGLLAAALLDALWRRVPALALRLPAAKAAAVLAFVAALGYGLVAGMGVPVQRTLLMLGVAALGLLCGRTPAPARLLLLALGVVVGVDPWAVLAAGFWLSFGAVGVILFVLGGRQRAQRRHSGWRDALRVQLAITLATVPMLLALFQSFSLVSPLANALAIPAVSFVITPLALLAAALPVDGLLLLAHQLCSALMVPLVWLAASDHALWRQAAPPAGLLAAALLAMPVVLLPRATPGRAAALIVLASLLLWQPVRPAPGSLQATVLDVGQGLAVHLQTATHDLLYDAGPPYGVHSDAGDRVVLPYLAAAGVERLDRLVLSHDDADHIGGARSVLADLPVAAVLAGEDDRSGLWRDALRLPGAGPDWCRAGERWQWDGVDFEVLHPPPAAHPSRRNNDQSCVLKVSAGAASLLLVGDLEAAGEQAMLARLGAEALASSVIVVGHHGSASSSSPAFVDAVLPEAAVHSAGYRNRFGHPHPAVWARWSEAGARNWRTDSQGAIRIGLSAAGVQLDAARALRPRYWHGR